MTTRKTRGPGGKSVLPRAARTTSAAGDKRGGRDSRDARDERLRRAGGAGGPGRTGGPARTGGAGRAGGAGRTGGASRTGGTGGTGRPTREARGPREDRGPRPDRPRSDRPRSDRPRTDRPRTERPRTDRPRGEFRPRDERGPRSDRPRSDRPRTDRPRSDHPRSDRPRTDRPRTERPRDERGPRTERPRGEFRPRDERGPRPERPYGERGPRGARPSGPGGARPSGAGGARPSGPRGARPARPGEGRGPRTGRPSGPRDDRRPGDRRGPRDDRYPRKRPTEATGRRFARPTRFDATTGRAVEEAPRGPRIVAGPTAPAATAPRRGPNVRDLALQALFQVHAKRAFAERVIDDLAEQFKLDVRDRGFLNELVKGTLRRQGTLDWQLDRLLHVGLNSLPLWIQDDLRLGAYQLMHLDRIPPRAVVDEAVKLALKYGHPGTAGLSNSVLRKLADAVGAHELPAPSPTKDDGTPDLDGMVALTSHPRWLVERWLARYGLADTLALCEANNRTAALGLRVNRLRLDRKELVKRLAAASLEAHEGRWTDVAVAVPADANFANFPSYARGDCTVQDESETLVGLLVAPKSGERVLDLCAAPGGKATHMAELMGDTGEVVAVEKMAPRARSMERQIQRLGLKSVIVETADGEEANLLAMGKGGLYDRALVDAPCSSLGVLARRADARWRKEASGFAELAEHQGKLLRAAARVVKPGGVLVYSVCSFEPEESDEIVQSFLAGHDEWRIEDARAFVPQELVESTGAMRALPHKTGTDGAYAVRLVRRTD